MNYRKRNGLKANEQKKELKLSDEMLQKTKKKTQMVMMIIECCSFG